MRRGDFGLAAAHGELVAANIMERISKIKHEFVDNNLNVLQCETVITENDTI